MLGGGSRLLWEEEKNISGHVEKGRQNHRVSSSVLLFLNLPPCLWKVPPAMQSSWGLGCWWQVQWADHLCLHPSPVPQTSPSGTRTLPSSVSSMEKRKSRIADSTLLTWEVLARSPITAPCPVQVWVPMATQASHSLCKLFSPRQPSCWQFAVEESTAGQMAVRIPGRGGYAWQHDTTVSPTPHPHPAQLPLLPAWVIILESLFYENAAVGEIPAVEGS